MKKNEIDYFSKIGPAGQTYAMNKPFSDPECGNYLCDIGSIMNLLPPLPSKILDVGCGTGWTSILFSKMGYDVTGIDISKDMICAANELKIQNNQDRCTFLVADIENDDLGNTFDCVVFYDSLHHLDSPVKTLQQVYNCLRPEGSALPMNLDAAIPIQSWQPVPRSNSASRSTTLPSWKF